MRSLTEEEIKRLNKEYKIKEKAGLLTTFMDYTPYDLIAIIKCIVAGKLEDEQDESTL